MPERGEKVREGEETERPKAIQALHEEKEEG